MGTRHGQTQTATATCRRARAAACAWGCLVLAVVSHAEPATAPASRSERLVAEARAILATMKETTYQHRTEIDEARGVYKADCSGLVCHLLKKVAPGTYAAIPLEPGLRRPRAVEFYEAFRSPAEGGGLEAVPHVLDARPGDLIAWRRRELIAGENTGHIVIVSGPPQKVSDTLVKVEVIDSTTQPHEGDTRKDGATGVGRGTLYFTIDEAGKPQGYSKAREGKTVRAPIAIGRLVKGT